MELLAPTQSAKHREASCIPLARMAQELSCTRALLSPASLNGPPSVDLERVGSSARALGAPSTLRRRSYCALLSVGLHQACDAALCGRAACAGELQRRERPS